MRIIRMERLIMDISPALNNDNDINCFVNPSCKKEGFTFMHSFSCKNLNPW
jgi:hypothetical protein